MSKHKQQKGSSQPFILWPPSKDARLEVMEELAKRLSNPSLFSANYGIFTKEVARMRASSIEEEAFGATEASEDLEILSHALNAMDFYSKECTRLLEILLKEGPPTSFLLSGEGLMEAEEEANLLLKPLMELRSSVTKLSFSKRSFGLDAAKVALGILSPLAEQLDEVDLSNITAQTPTDEVSRVLSIFSDALGRCTLKSLDLSNNTIGDEGLAAFLLNHSRLQKLYLVNVGIINAQNIYRELSESTYIKVLHFGEDMIDDNGGRHIGVTLSHLPHLEDFQCSSTNMGHAGALHLAVALQHSTYLEKLNLSSNRFDYGGDPDLIGIRISESLACHGRRLTEINLSDVGLGNLGVIALSNVLKENSPSLEVLSMAANNFTAMAISALAECIASKECLVKLNLSRNKLNDQDATDICKAFKEGHSRLKEVDLSWNRIEIAGARFLCQVVVHKAKFQLLNIRGNIIFPNDINELRGILPGHLVVDDDDDLGRFIV